MFADALMLAKQADGVIIVAEWSKTTKKELISATDLIRRSGGKVMGVLINKVKVDILISRSMVCYKKYYARPRKLGLI
jgi:Mrp family chromosome partitioning ATPase